jgi:CheY-like chemotaxis protein
MNDVQPTQLPSHVLILEDNAIILLDTEEMLKEMGVATVLTATTPKEALLIIEKSPPQFGLLDVDLGFDTCFAVAERLTGLRIPFAFATGYADNHQIPARFAGIACVRKPYTAEAVLAVLKGAKR